MTKRDSWEEAEELADLVEGALDRMRLGCFYTGLAMEIKDFRICAGTALDRFRALRRQGKRKPANGADLPGPHYT